MDRFDDKLDKISEHIANIDMTLANQASDLHHHIKRTDLLEAQIKPIQDHMTELKGIIKALKFLAVLASIIEAAHYIMR